MTEFKKNSVAMRVSLEQLTMFASGDWRRKVDYTEEIPVPEQEWDEYHEAVALLERLREFDNFNEGCSCEYAYIDEPRPRTIFHYAETEEEWEARVRAKLDAGEQPDNRVEDAFLQMAQAASEMLCTPSIIAGLPSEPAQGEYGYRPYEVRNLGGAVRDYKEFVTDRAVEYIRERNALDAFNKECNE